MNISGILDKIRDPYDRRARVAPGLWVLFPLLTAAVCLVGPKHPLLTAMLSLIGACGGPYLLGNLVRVWGVNAQQRLYAKWGGRPTTLLLRHRDNTIDPISKQRYHDLAARKLGVPMPSMADEADDLESADNAYRSVTERLIGKTRDTQKFSLLFKELIGYGFNRNMYGARWVGSVICVITIFAVLFHAGVLQFGSLGLYLDRINLLGFGEWITIVISVLLLLLWLFHFSERTVRGAGFSYGIRLLECLENIAAPATRKS